MIVGTQLPGPPEHEVIVSVVVVPTQVDGPRVTVDGTQVPPPPPLVPATPVMEDQSTHEVVELSRGLSGTLA